MSNDLNFLMEMGFSKLKAEKALAETGNCGIEQAMEWLMNHENEPDATAADATAAQDTVDPVVEVPNKSPDTSTSVASHGEPSESGVARSIKCDDCGKLLRNVEEAEFHATKTGHANFSESVEEKKPLTEAEKKEQVAKLQEKLRLKRMEREEKEKREEREREKQRRTMGKDIVSAKAKHDELEMKKILEERRREKEEDKLAKQRIRAELEKDKLERAKKFSKTNSNETSTPASAPAASSPSGAQAQPNAVKKSYDSCRLQIRYTNGQAVTQEFQAKESLAAVRLFVQLNRPDGASPFVLMTTFPRKVFTEEDMSKPLAELGLVPSAVLVVTKSS